MLALVDDFRTIDWVKEYPFPVTTLNEIKTLLAETRETILWVKEKAVP